VRWRAGEQVGAEDGETEAVGVDEGRAKAGVGGGLFAAAGECVEGHGPGAGGDDDLVGVERAALDEPAVDLGGEPFPDVSLVGAENLAEERAAVLVTELVAGLVAQGRHGGSVPRAGGRRGLFNGRDFQIAAENSSRAGNTDLI